MLVASTVAGDTSLRVSSTSGFSGGDLVMVLQTSGLSLNPPSGDQSPVDVSASPTAHWELARVASVDTTTAALLLTAPMITAFAQAVSQVLTVPEYSDLTITSAGSIVAQPWSLTSGGGVIAFLVNGPIVNNGSISADRAGFRGGSHVDDPGFLGSMGCSGLDEPPTKGAQKGEGLANSRYGASSTGRGNVANGGGGSVCQASGGAGGGNFGLGGPGGYSHDNARPVGGLGGASLVYSLLDHLTLGGGGGAGHGLMLVSPGAPGAAGGGAIFIRAKSITGNSAITANGESASDATSGGGGGGGAGGSIYLRCTGVIACPAGIRANGGTGSSLTSAEYGPGGGGGGGRILLQQGDVPACTTISVSAGLGGTQTNSSADGGLMYGSGPTAAERDMPPFVGTVVTLDGGFSAPPVPTITNPVNGDILTDTRPEVRGTGASLSATAIIYLDGPETGRTSTDGAGNFTFRSGSDWALGPHTLEAASEYQGVRSARSSAVNFVIVSPDGGTGDGGMDDGGMGDGGETPGGRFGGGGCHCAATSGSGFGQLLGLVFLISLALRRSKSRGSKHR